MLESNLRHAPTRCREAFPKRLQNVCELGGAQPAIDLGEVLVLALTSP